MVAAKLSVSAPDQDSVTHQDTIMVGEEVTGLALKHTKIMTECVRKGKQ